MHKNVKWRKKLPPWSPDFAYAIGLLVTDGSISKDGRHIVFTSKDRQLIGHIAQILRVNGKVGRKSSGALTTGERRYYYLQFSNVALYRFLNTIGIHPNKTKTIRQVLIPSRYFFHFLRGHFDGDGTFYSYHDPRWTTSFLYYLVFISASYRHLAWIRDTLQQLTDVKGSLVKKKNHGIYKLGYAKREAYRIIQKMYPTNDVPCLTRKRLKIERALAILEQSDKP